MKLRFYIATLLATIFILSSCNVGEQVSSSSEESQSVSSSQSSSSVPSVSASSASEEGRAQSEPEPESSSSEIDAQETAAAPSTVFELNKSDILFIHSYDPPRFAYHRLQEQDFDKLISMINALEPLAKIDISEKETPQRGIMVTLTDHTKFQYNLIPSGIEVDGQAYMLPAEKQEQLANLAEVYNNSRPAYAQWLTYFRPSRVQEMTYEKFISEPSANRTVCAENIAGASTLLKNIQVVASSGKAVRDIDTPADFLYVSMVFDSGISQHVYICRDKMYVYTSDMDFYCEYALADPSQFDGLELKLTDLSEGQFAPLENPSTGKPVIYLYPPSATDVSVKLDFKGTLGYTYPSYDGGWNVTAHPDGRLVNKPDGSEHYYLFWDGNPDVNEWDFSEGFVVPGNETEAFLRDMLPKLGLLPREYNDFIVYWVPELSRNRFNLIKFATDEYEFLAPLTVTPAPDTVLRVHMVYKPLSQLVTVKEQQLPPTPRRTGFTVVEWGGTRPSATSGNPNLIQLPK